MKAINLYDMVAVDKAPEKIMYSDSYYEYHKSVHDYYCSGEGWLFEILDDLNEEVEIIGDKPKEEIQEDERIGKLSHDYEEPIDIWLIKETINEIIDKLEGGEQ